MRVKLVIIRSIEGIRAMMMNRNIICKADAVPSPVSIVMSGSDGSIKSAAKARSLAGENRLNAAITIANTIIFNKRLLIRCFF
jgi:hypothetical protein